MLFMSCSYTVDEYEIYSQAVHNSYAPKNAPCVKSWFVHYLCTVLFAGYSPNYVKRFGLYKSYGVHSSPFSTIPITITTSFLNL